MNREERRKLNKINIKEQNDFLIENVRSIYDVLNDTEELIEKVSKNIVKVQVPQNVIKVCKESAKTLENFSQNFYGIREMFLHDKKCNNGFVKKSIVSALKVPMYKKNLDEFVESVRENKGKGTTKTVDYLIWHDLSANTIEVKRTLDVLEKALPIMIANLKANNVADKNVTYLVIHLATLERRLYQLYCLYGHYLKDTGNIMEYHLGYKVFEIFDNAFSNLIEVLEIPY